jgi:NADP-dependent 3-hydroxy acid dehydrogenase YdfG
MVQGFEDRWGPLLIGDDVANAIHYIVTQPPHVHISDIMIRPTRQDYP